MHMHVFTLTRALRLMDTSFITSSKTRPRTHWQPCTHCKVHISGLGISHVGGQAVPHSLYTWPGIEHFLSVYKH